MSAVGRVGPNAVWLLFGRLASQGLIVACTVLLAVRLGVAGLGGYAFIAAVVSVANVATTFGTDMVLIREIAGGGRTELWSAALAVQLGLSGLAVAGIWLVAPIIPGQTADTSPALRLLSLSLAPAALFSVCSAVLRGRGRMRRHALLAIATAALQLGAVWMLVPPGASLVRLAGVLGVVQLMGAGTAWLACAADDPAFRCIPVTSGADVRSMLVGSGRIGMLGLVGVAYQRAAIVVVALLVGPVATGWFAAGAKVLEAAKTGHIALLGALYPALAERRVLPGASVRDHDRRLAWPWRLAVVGAAVVAVGLALGARALVGRLFAPTFEPAARGLTILALALVPWIVANYRSIELLAIHRESLTLRALFVSLLALVVLLGVLVPTLGWTGAAWAILGAETIQATLLLGVTGGLIGLRGRIAGSRVSASPAVGGAP